MQQNILDEIYDFLGKYVWFPNDYYRAAVTAWVAHTALIDVFEEQGYATPRLAVLSPEKRSGKTRLLEIIKLLVQNPKSMLSPSSASLYTLIELSDVTPTLLLDEIGRMLERKDISEFLAIVEAGFQPGQSVSRVSLETVRKVEDFRIYAPMLMAGIDNGRMPDTIFDRSINLRMRRNIGKRLKYRPRVHAAEGLTLGAKLADWGSSVSEKVKDLDPVLPDELNDREQDKWEPLFIVGRLADMPVTDVTGVTIVTDVLEGWETRIKRAALELSKEDKDIEPASNNQILLRDIYDIVKTIEDKISSSSLLDGLNSLEYSPWRTYLHDKPLDGRGLAKMLGPFSIKPKTIRFKEKVDKGYYKSDFKEAFEQYLELQAETTVTSVTELQRLQGTEENLPVEDDNINLYNNTNYPLTQRELYMPSTLSALPTLPTNVINMNAMSEEMFNSMCE
jgi:hypothetical protein